jgi:glycosyltransferase involved in cell wall biosynthesis
MRILLLTMQLGRTYGQGSERYAESLGSALAASGHEVGYLAGDPRGLEPPRPLGAPVDAERRLYSHSARSWFAVMGTAPGRVAAFLRRERPDLVHVVNPAHVGVGAMLAARRLGIPVVVTAMDFWWVCPRATLLRGGTQPCSGSPGWRDCARCIASDHPHPGLRALARRASLAPALVAAWTARCVRRGGSPVEAVRWMRRRRFLAKCLAGADQVIFPSPATRDAILPLVGHGRWQLIPYGLEEQWFAAQPRERTRPRTPEELVLGFAGALQPHKGAHVLLAALRRLGWTGTRVRVAGGSDDVAYQESLRRDTRGLRVEFTGALSRAGMQAFLGTLDALVVPSLWRENLPYVLLEAQAAGVPVLASRVPGMAAQVGDPARLFEPGSDADLARVLRRFLDGAPREATPRVATLAEMARATEDVYRRALAARAAHVAEPGDLAAALATPNRLVSLHQQWNADAPRRR